VDEWSKSEKCKKNFARRIFSSDINSIWQLTLNIDSEEGLAIDVINSFTAKSNAQPFNHVA
jgi:hypothetical protein